MSEARALEATEVEYVNVDVEVGIVIQSLMFRHREQQKDVAAIAGVSQASLSRKLRGVVSFSMAELYRIARHYGVEAGDLLPRLDSNQQPCGYLSEQVSSVDDETWALAFDGWVTSWASCYGETARPAWAAWCLGQNGDVPGPASDGRDWHELVAVIDRWV